VRNKRRSLLTIVSIGASLSLLGLLLGLYHAFYFAKLAPEAASRVRYLEKGKLLAEGEMPDEY
jgi:hypothetical protein